MKLIAAIGALVAILLLMQFGTLSPCGMLRERAKQQDSLTAVLPDALVDLALAAQLGALTPAKCVAALLGGPSKAPAPKREAPQSAPPALATPAPRTNSAAIRAAFQEADNANSECRAMRLRGELKGYGASAECATARIKRAFHAAGVSEALVTRFTAMRVYIARKADSGEITVAQGEQEYSQLGISFTREIEAEQQRK